MRHLVPVEATSFHFVVADDTASQAGGHYCFVANGGKCFEYPLLPQTLLMAHLPLDNHNSGVKCPVNNNDPCPFAVPTGLVGGVVSTAFPL